MQIEATSAPDYAGDNGPALDTLAVAPMFNSGLAQHGDPSGASTGPSPAPASSPAPPATRRRRQRHHRRLLQGDAQAAAAAADGAALATEPAPGPAGQDPIPGDGLPGVACTPPYCGVLIAVSADVSPRMGYEATPQGGRKFRLPEDEWGRLTGDHTRLPPLSRLPLASTCARPPRPPLRRRAGPRACHRQRQSWDPPRVDFLPRRRPPALRVAPPLTSRSLSFPGTRYLYHVKTPAMTNGSSDGHVRPLHTLGATVPDHEGVWPPVELFTATVFPRAVARWITLVATDPVHWTVRPTPAPSRGPWVPGPRPGVAEVDALRPAPTRRLGA